MIRENGNAMNHHVAFIGRSLKPVFKPGVYCNNAARAVSKNRPKFNIWFVIPCWKTDSLLVFDIMTSAHCTTTIDVKNAVWHVSSKFFRCCKSIRYRMNRERHCCFGRPIDFVILSNTQVGNHSLP